MNKRLNRKAFQDPSILLMSSMTEEYKQGKGNKESHDISKLSSKTSTQRSAKPPLSMLSGQNLSSPNIGRGKLASK